MAKKATKKAATKKAPSKKVKKGNSVPVEARPICATRGCRVEAEPGSDLCAACGASANPVDAVYQVTELEAERFSRLEAEARGHLQGARILELEMEQLKIAFDAKMAQLGAQRRAMLEAANAAVKESGRFNQELAKKYGIDPKDMVIDPDSRAIRTREQT